LESKLLQWHKGASIRTAQIELMRVNTIIKFVLFSSGTGFSIPPPPFWDCRCPKVCGNPADGATCPVRLWFSIDFSDNKKPPKPAKAWVVLGCSLKPCGRDNISHPEFEATCYELYAALSRRIFVAGSRNRTCPYYASGRRCERS